MSEQMQMVDIPPDTNQVLADVAREGMGWEASLSEPIDNSLDAGADRIVITIDKKQKLVRINDNGDGCAEPHRMFVSGYSTKRGRQKQLGRYGVGLKHASFYLCKTEGRTTVVTGNAGAFRQAVVCWGDIVESGRWQIPAPLDLTAMEVTPTLPDLRGTSITFQPIRCGWLADDQQRKMEQKLAFTFSPAIRAGKQIKLVVSGKSRILTAPEDPVWSESIEFEVAIEGKRARVRAGILAANDQSGRRGMSYAYGHRVIVADTNDGCGEHSTQGFAGFVELDERWGLGQNKSQVVDNDWPLLCDAIRERLDPLLTKLRNSAHQVQSEALRGEIAGALNSMLGAGNPKRPGRRGTKRLAGASVDRQVKRSRVVDGLGEVIGRRKAGGITIDWDDDPEKLEAAKVDPSGTRVYLNRAKRVVARAAEKGDSEMLAVIAACHYFHFATRGNLWGIDKFDDAMGRLLDSEIVVRQDAVAFA